MVIVKLQADLIQFTQEFDLYEAVGGAIFGEEVWLAGGVGLELSDLVAIGYVHLYSTQADRQETTS